MSRELLAGSVLNEIAGSTERWPDWRVVVHNPRQTTFNQVADGSVRVPPLDISAYVEIVRYRQNVGFENSNNPTLTMATFRFHRNPITSENLRRGLIENGVIVQIFQGDLRVKREDYQLVFTGTFRGTPGDDPGTPAQLTEGMEASAYGREQRFLEMPPITTDVFPADTDVGQIALAVATKAMGLGQDEIRFGAQGFRVRHVSNQVVETNCLDALWQILFCVGKKPSFDAQGRLVAVDVSLDKPAARIFSAGDVTVESRQAQPNDVETNNLVHLQGLSSILSKAKQSTQLLESIDVVTGFFDELYKKSIYYSQDRTQRAEDTYATARKRIWFSAHEWTEKDEFHGVLSIDTHYLFYARATIFALYLATELAIASIDYFFQADSGVTGLITSFVTATAAEDTLATERLALKIASQVALAGLLWSMNFIGRGTYEIFGDPFEFIYQVLETKAKLPGLSIDEIRTAEFRNDFLSTMDELDARAKELLRRELVKNQLYQISLMDDPLLEVDDVIELSSGERFYILTIDKTLQRNQKATMTLSCWKIFDPKTAAIEALEAAA